VKDKGNWKNVSNQKKSSYPSHTSDTMSHSRHLCWTEWDFKSACSVDTWNVICTCLKRVQWGCKSKILSDSRAL